MLLWVVARSAPDPDTTPAVYKLLYRRPRDAGLCHPCSSSRMHRPLDALLLCPVAAGGMTERMTAATSRARQWLYVISPGRRAWTSCRRVTRWLGRGGWFPGRTGPPTARSPTPWAPIPVAMCSTRAMAASRSRSRGGPGWVRRQRPAGRDDRGEGPGGGGLVANAGRYSFHGDRVSHHVELSLFPNEGVRDASCALTLTGTRP